MARRKLPPLPDNIIIFGRPWRVRRSDRTIIAGVLGQRKKDFVGACDRESREIHVDRDLEGALADGTEFHEVLHAVFPEWSEDRVLDVERRLTPVIRRWLGAKK